MRIAFDHSRPSTSRPEQIPENPGRHSHFPLKLVQAMSLLVTLILVSAAYADNQLNGAPRRPFYVFAHNPNSLWQVEADVNAGANALEPDITLAFQNLIQLCSPTDFSLDNLVMWDSSFNRDGRCSDTKLLDWLDGVHTIAATNPQLALVVFDVKPSAALPAFGPLIVEAIRSHLNHDGVKLNVIISVGSFNNFGIFDQILAPGYLGDREGVQVDGEADSGAVVNTFFSRSYYGNIGFGDGTALLSSDLVVAMDGAVGNRAAFGYPKAVTYVYTIESEDTMRTYIDAGVDGIIPDGFPAVAGLEALHIQDLLALVDGRSDIRLAKREDDPFASPPEAYALYVRTMDETGAGTDANITFTLNGALGSSTIVVNTAPPNRMEDGDDNWVTIPSKNLGALYSITLSVGGGIDFPNWHLEDITVRSARWLGPNVYTGAALHDTIQAGSTYTLQLPVDEYVWGGFGADGAVTPTHWQKFADAYKWVAPGGTIHLASGQYADKMTLTKPCTLTFWAEHGTTPAVIGSP